MKSEQKRIDLLDGKEYQADLKEIDHAFTQIQQNKEYLQEVMGGKEPEEWLKK